MASYGLIVDSDAQRAHLYESAMAKLGLEPVVVESTDDALEMVQRRGPPLLLISDVGVALSQRLAEVIQAERLPAVLVSRFPTLLQKEPRLTELMRDPSLTQTLAPNSSQEDVERCVQTILAGRVEGRAPGVIVAAWIETTRESVERIRRALPSKPGIPTDDSLEVLASATAEALGVQGALLWLKSDKEHRLQLSQELGEWRADTTPTVTPSPLDRLATWMAGGRITTYAGVSSGLPDGKLFATVVLFDSKPVSMTADTAAILRSVTRRLAGELCLPATGPPDSAGQIAAASDPHPSEIDDIARTLRDIDPALFSLDRGVLLVDARGRIVYANKAFAVLFGSTSQELVGLSREQFVYDSACRFFRDPIDCLRTLWLPLSGPAVALEDFVMELPKRRVIRWSCRPIGNPNAPLLIEVYTDITAQADLSADVRLALTDSVTGFINRRAGEELLTKEVARAHRYGSPLSVALVDIDYLKTVNDTHGHHRGDSVLRAVATTITRSLRQADAAARWGGDEFLLILPGVGLDGATTFAERVQRSVRLAAVEGVGHVTISVGVAEFGSSEEPLATVARADLRLYEAKAAGRDTVR